MWLTGKSREYTEEFIDLSELLERFVMEPNRDESWKDTLDSEESAFNLLQLVQHGQNYFFLKIKEVHHLLRVKADIHWLLF